MYKTSLFIFRRDLRLVDNTGLEQALKLSKEVIPCFIFDPEQVAAHNPYRSLNALQYMIASIKELSDDLGKKKSRLFLFLGHPQNILEEILRAVELQAVFVNRDYTPFSRQRDEKLSKFCSQKGVSFISTADSLLNEPEELLKENKEPYRIFTAFYNKALMLPVRSPSVPKHEHYYKRDLKLKHLTSFDQVEQLEWGLYHNASLFRQGGRSEALNILNSLSPFKHYEQTHDQLSMATTGLSPINKFGTASIREVYQGVQTLTGSAALARQLYWRDFFTYVAYHYPHVFGHPFNQRYEHLAWDNDEHFFSRWCEGTTGFPLVDAGMRQLNTTGFMHNRARLVVSSFLVKDMHIDWRWGERYFAQQLVDYDPCVNNGNWQWAASTGCDAQPYFRIFNPWLQQKKFDPTCTYIKQWVPELKDVDPAHISAWYKYANERSYKYPKPMLDHATQAAYAQKLFRSLQRKI